MIKQRTLKKSISATGVGLHSGKKVKLTLVPAAKNTSIVFQRIDCSPVVTIPVDPISVGDTVMASCLFNGKTKVGTVEHLMSALAGMGIDNLLIKIDAPEVPILDGSATPFIFLITQAGIAELEEAKTFLRVKKTVRVTEEDKWAQLEPYDGYNLSFSINFEHPAVGRSSCYASFDFASQSYMDEIANARTFGFSNEVEALRSKGLALGGSLETAIVLDETSILNAEGLRVPDEFARHKLLDAIGDLYLVGHPLLAHFSAHKSGHALNNQLLRSLLSEPGNFELVQFDKKKSNPKTLSAIEHLYPCLA